MLTWLTSFSVTHWLGIGIDYIVAGVMVAGGIYLAAFFDLADANPLAWLLRPLRYVGYGLVVCGVAYGYGTYRESVGAAACQSAWQAKNYEQQIVNLKRDLAAQKSAAEFKAQEVKDLAAQKANADEQISAYANYAAGLSSSLGACRRATADDDRRLCDIIGNAAPGCKPAR